MKVDLSVNFAGIKLKNPVLTASGTFGYGYEVADLIPLKKLGGIITKTITLKERAGNCSPRIAEVESGLINSIGLQNIGVRAFVDEPLEKLKKIGVPIIVSIAGEDIKSCVDTVKILNNFKEISAIEINLSCPNLNKKVVCNDIPLMKGIIKQVKKISKFPVIAKLSPLVSDISAIALAAQNCGADGINAANTYLSMAVDIKTFKPKLGAIKGGLSGTCIKPISVRCVYEIYQKVRVPIVGCGGIMSGADVMEYMLVGSSAVSVGSASLLSPKHLIKIIDEFEQLLIEKNINKAKKLV
ncbi:MAG: dihydroorotate dehydrogenase, partial [Elusimicrobiota bacterium]|nr:dihydroorotate dehydrogenase [Elusimicrobiota bacterium]